MVSKRSTTAATVPASLNTGTMIEMSGGAASANRVLLSVRGVTHRKNRTEVLLLPGVVAVVAKKEGERR